MKNRDNIINIKLLITKVILIIFLFSSVVFTQEKIVVGTKIANPFVIKTEHNQYSGISIELWKAIAADINLDYEIREFSLPDLIESVKKKEVDIAVSPLTITAEREQFLDFTHSYYTTGLGIAVKRKDSNSIISYVNKIFSLEFIRVISVIFLILFIIGFLIWFLERKSNTANFESSPKEGIGSGFWWAAVTLTTVGYGDKVPKTWLGRLIGLIWMFAGLIIVSSFTGAVASVLTVESLDANFISSVDELYQTKIVTIESTSSEEYLTNNNFNYSTVKSIQEGFKKLETNKIDAFVYDSPILKYYIKSNELSDKFIVLPIVLEPINYAFALSEDNPLIEIINLSILKQTSTKKWKKRIKSYIGR